MSDEEISPPSSKSSSSNPPKNAPSWLKNFVVWAHASRHLLTALAAVLVALAALLRPQDHTVTKNSYEATTAGIAKVEDEIRKNHEDIVALRSYIDGVMHQSVSLPTEAAPAASPSPSPSAVPRSTPRHRISLSDALGAAIPNISSIAESSSPPPMAPAAALLLNEVPPPPPVHDEPKPWKPPAFDAIEKK